MIRLEENDADLLIGSLDGIIKRLSELNCSDSGCRFSKSKGMHTNGGCRCLKHLPYEKRVQLEKLFWALGGKL